MRWFDAQGQLVLEQGERVLPAVAVAAEPHWQHWTRGISLWQPVFTRPRQVQRDRPQLAGFVQVGLSTQPLEQELTLAAAEPGLCVLAVDLPLV